MRTLPRSGFAGIVTHHVQDAEPVLLGEGHKIRNSSGTARDTLLPLSNPKPMHPPTLLIASLSQVQEMHIPYSEKSHQT